MAKQTHVAAPNTRARGLISKIGRSPAWHSGHLDLQGSVALASTLQCP